MRYLLLIYSAQENAPQPNGTEFREMMEGYRVFTEDVQKRGLMQAGEALQPTSTATTVRVRNGERLVTDGPFAETKEQLGGYFIVEAKNLDEAIAIAARIPSVRVGGSIEVRPIMEIDFSK